MQSRTKPDQMTTLISFVHSGMRLAFWRMQQPAANPVLAPGAGSGYGDGERAGGGVDHRVAGPHVGLPGRGDPAAGQRHHSETPVHGRLRRQGRRGALSDRSRPVSGGVRQRRRPPLPGRRPICPPSGQGRNVFANCLPPKRSASRTSTMRTPP